MMFGLRPLLRSAAPGRSWTCLQCSLRPKPRISESLPQSGPRFASNASKSAQTPKAKKQKAGRGLIVVASVGLLGAAAATYTDSGRFVVDSVMRSSRVVYTLSVCVKDYRRTLERKEFYDESEWDEVLRKCHQRCADRTLKAIEKNRSIFIKLGQHLTSLNYLLPTEWCDTFIPLQDQCPVSSFDSVKNLVENDTGMAFDDLFSEFEEKPLGAASLAQVHSAVDRASGQRVAVKIQHPVLDDWAPLDIALTKFTFSTLKRVFPEYDLTWLSNEMQKGLTQELDFALEARNALDARHFFANVKDCPLMIPDVLWSRRRILTMQYISGHRIDDLNYLAEHKISPDEVSAALSRIFNTMIFSPDAPLHCDPHGGNIAIVASNDRKSRYNFSIILYDHGLYRIIPRDTQRSYARLWLAVLDGDELGMRQAAYDCAGITSDEFPLFASAITGRDYRVISQRGVDSTARSDEEKEAMSSALGDGMLQDLVALLGKVPSIILLILKTNDLTRSLDTTLHTRQGPMRSFLILARYAAQTVLDEQVERLRAAGGLLWPPRNAASFVVAWLRYAKVVVRLKAYESVLYARGMLGFENPDPMAGLGG